MVRPTIPFNRFSIQGNELSYMSEATASGHLAAKGPFTDKVVGLLQEELSASHILLTTSCTSALELSAMFLDLTPQDNVVLPSFTFVSTALAFARTGVELRFADIEPTTLGIDPESASDLVDSSTRAIVPVHYAGISADLDGLLQLVATFANLSMIEDNAHGLYGSAPRGPLGSFGRFSTLSFHETKNFSCGEGGALVINREEDVARAHVLYDKGTNREAFLTGAVESYSWMDLGSSFGMSDLLAAFLLGQLEQRPQVMARRKAIHDRYFESLSPLQETLGFRLPVIPDDSEPAYHIVYFLISDAERRTAVLRLLAESGIAAVFHYQPLHNSPGAMPWISRSFNCPVTESVSRRIVRLPFYASLTNSEIDRVVEALIGALQTTK